MGESDRLLVELEAERDRLIRLTRMGIGMPMAGMLFWLLFAFLVARYKIEGAVVLAFFATGLVFPAGVGITRMLGGDLFAKSRSLASLGLILAAVQLFYWPVIITLFLAAPAWTPYAIAVLFGSHFLPYMWLYRSFGYGLLAVLTAVATTATVLIARGPAPLAVTLVAAACYLVALLILRREVGAVLHGSPSRAD
jgi:hypothetical protein